MIRWLLKTSMFDTSSKTTFRLIRSGTLSASENMAIDKVLFENFSQTQKPLLRLYSWEKSFTFGLSDSIEKIQKNKALQPYGKNYAKRMTGGGILFHGNDISYALTIPTSYMQGLSVKASYEKMCQFLLHFYQSLGLEAMYAKDDKRVTLSKNAFCQLGFEDYDILIEGKKIGGNAQRRTKEAIFQHGSIGLFSLDNTAYTGNSLEDFGIDVSYAQAGEKLIESFEKTFEVVLEDSILYEEEKNKLQALTAKEAS